MPGIIPVTPNNPFLGLGSYNSNGGRGRGNNITLDGATINRRQHHRFRGARHRADGRNSGIQPDHQPVQC